jgi:ribosome-associated heat shock protein Hsp15
MVTRGKVRMNARITKKPASAVRVGDVLTLVQGHHVRVVRVLGLPERRGSASDAAVLYEDVNQD